MSSCTGLFNTRLCTQPCVSPRQEMFKGFSICHIKACTAIGTMLTPVPNFLPLLLFLSSSLPFSEATPPSPPLSAESASIYPLTVCQVCGNTDAGIKGEAGDILNPLSQTDDAMAQQFTPPQPPPSPSSTPHPAEGSSNRVAAREGAQVSASSRCEGRLFNQRLRLGKQGTGY